MAPKVHWFLTVDWCNQGKRGVFCKSNGVGFWRNHKPATDAEVIAILGPFALILSPEWRPFTMNEVQKYCHWRPLAEFNNVYGYAVAEAL